MISSSMSFPSCFLNSSKVLAPIPSCSKEFHSLNTYWRSLLWRCFPMASIKRLYLPGFYSNPFLLTLGKNASSFYLKDILHYDCDSAPLFYCLLSKTGSVFNINRLISGFVALVLTISWLLLWLKDTVRLPTHKHLIHLRGFRASCLVANYFSRRATVSLRPMSICHPLVSPLKCTFRAAPICWCF